MGCWSSREEGQEVATFERSEPLLDFDCKGFEYGGVQVAQVAVQGWRKTMEDVALVQYGVSPREDTLALGVFDGHSGGDAARFAQEKLLWHIKETDEWKRGDVGAGCIHGFMEADEAMRKAEVRSGTTAVLALLSPDSIVVANCGDSRSVLSRGGRQLPMSVDHKPGRKAESRRIVRSGGYLDETDPRHPRVVCDTLKMSIATSRALGDFDFKANPSRQPEEQMISPVPELYTRQRVPEDEFLILASDGVWDVMDNPGIVSFLQMEAASLDHKEAANGGGVRGEGGETRADHLAKAVVQRCLRLGSRDNMTIVLADLRPRKTRRKRPPLAEEVPSAAPRSVGGDGGGGVGAGGDDSENSPRTRSPAAATVALSPAPPAPAPPAPATTPAGVTAAPAVGGAAGGVDPGQELRRNGTEVC
ncbi:unnamed protein product, partial [Pylaiella littoralis]